MWDFTLYQDRPALREDTGSVLTYRELMAATAALAPYFATKVLCTILCRNTIGSVTAYVGTYLNGSVPMLLNAALEDSLLHHLLELYRPAYLFVPSEQRSRFSSCTEQLQLYQYSLLKTGFAQHYPLHRDLALLLSSSGSTGSPKFVRQSYRNVESNTGSICSFLALNAHERPITTLPMYYTYGLSVLNTHLQVGATILLTEKSLMQREFWAFLQQERATSLSGVPYTYEMLDRLRFTTRSLPELKTLTQAGGHLNPHLQQRLAAYCEQHDKRLFIMYGQAEATARISYLPYNLAGSKLGSIGVAIPGGSLSLENAKGQPVTEPHREGELVYTGPNVTLGYAQGPEDLSLGDENRGVLHTQDLGYMDEDGYFYITGRKNRVVKIFGNRLNLEELEDLLAKAYPHLDFALAGRTDLICIFVTQKQDPATICNYLASKTHLNAVAFKVVPLEELPRNDQGKILYTKLQTIVENS